MNPKTCRLCRKVLPWADFLAKKSSPDGKDTRCKKCHLDAFNRRRSAESPEKKEARLKHEASLARSKRKPHAKTCKCCAAAFEAKNKRTLFCSVKCLRRGDSAKQEKMRVYTRATYNRVYAWLSAYKMERGCADCGYNKHPAALQLDHEGPKSHHIADLRHNIERLKEEIEKGQCVVRCANCHAIKTLERKLAAKKA